MNTYKKDNFHFIESKIHMYLVHRVFIYQSINHYREIDTNLKVTTAYLFYFYFRKVVIRQRNRNKQNICIINFLVCAPAIFPFHNHTTTFIRCISWKHAKDPVSISKINNTDANSQYLHPYNINIICHEYLEIVYINIVHIVCIKYVTRRSLSCVYQLSL